MSISLPMHASDSSHRNNSMKPPTLSGTGEEDGGLLGPGSPGEPPLRNWHSSSPAISSRLTSRRHTGGSGSPLSFALNGAPPIAEKSAGPRHPSGAYTDEHTGYMYGLVTVSSWPPQSLIASTRAYAAHGPRPSQVANGTAVMHPSHWVSEHPQPHHHQDQEPPEQHQQQRRLSSSPYYVAMTNVSEGAEGDVAEDPVATAARLYGQHEEQRVISHRACQYGTAGQHIDNTGNDQYLPVRGSMRGETVPKAQIARTQSGYQNGYGSSSPNGHMWAGDEGYESPYGPLKSLEDELDEGRDAGMREVATTSARGTHSNSSYAGATTYTNITGAGHSMSLYNSSRPGSVIGFLDTHPSGGGLGGLSSIGGKYASVFHGGLMGSTGGMTSGGAGNTSLAAGGMERSSTFFSSPTGSFREGGGTGAEDGDAAESHLLATGTMVRAPLSDSDDDNDGERDYGKGDDGIQQLPTFLWVPPASSNAHPDARIGEGSDAKAPMQAYYTKVSSTATAAGKADKDGKRNRLGQLLSDALGVGRRSTAPTARRRRGDRENNDTDSDSDSGSESESESDRNSDSNSNSGTGTGSGNGTGSDSDSHRDTSTGSGSNSDRGTGSGSGSGSDSGDDDSNRTDSDKEDHDDDSSTSDDDEGEAREAENTISAFHRGDGEDGCQDDDAEEEEEEEEEEGRRRIGHTPCADNGSTLLASRQRGYGATAPYYGVDDGSREGSAADQESPSPENPPDFVDIFDGVPRVARGPQPQWPEGRTPRVRNPFRPDIPRQRTQVYMLVHEMLDFSPQRDARWVASPPEMSLLDFVLPNGTVGGPGTTSPAMAAMGGMAVFPYAGSQMSRGPDFY